MTFDERSVGTVASEPVEEDRFQLSERQSNHDR